MNIRYIVPFLLGFSFLANGFQQEMRFPATIKEVQAEVMNARLASKNITIAGAGKGNSVKTTGRDTIVLNQKYMNKIINLDVAYKKITVQPGITWGEIQESINYFGLAISAMQSYCDFSVGGTIGVNAHGQDFRFAPIAQTIDSLLIVDAHGQLLRLSKTENSELFSLVIGGYGLFGIIVEATLQLIDNTMLEKEVFVARNNKLFANADQLINNDNIALYSARFDMGSKKFMARAINIVYYDTYEKTKDPIEAIMLPDSVKGFLFNKSFDAARKYKFLRDFRVLVEKNIIEVSSNISRNNAMHYITSSLSHNDHEKIEILQEYFIPLSEANRFIAQAKDLLLLFDVDVLNCTLRYVKQDSISFLPYASETVAAFVFYCSIDNDKNGFDNAQIWTRNLIDIALACNGRFYLPYYCFATKEQVRKAYPEFDSFIELKKKYDPQEILINDLYLSYR